MSQEPQTCVNVIIKDSSDVLFGQPICRVHICELYDRGIIEDLYGRVFVANTSVEQPSTTQLSGVIASVNLEVASRGHLVQPEDII
jgi:hypothetical protein